MIVERMPVAVVVERRPARSRWQDHVWRVVAVLPGAPETPPWSVLGEADGIVRYHAGTADLVAYSTDTKSYKDNLEASTPSVYAVLRRGDTASGWTLLMATVDPTEAHAHVDVGDDLVEALPMPKPVFEGLSAFVARHHVERKDWKRRRDRADPEALARRPRAQPEDEP